MIDRLVSAIRSAGFLRESDTIERAESAAERIAAIYAASGPCHEGHEIERHLGGACLCVCHALEYDVAGNPEDAARSQRCAAEYLDDYDRWAGHERKWYSYGELVAQRISQASGP
jgi:hypothetical protein